MSAWWHRWAYKLLIMLGVVLAIDFVLLYGWWLPPWSGVLGPVFANPAVYVELCMAYVFGQFTRELFVRCDCKCYVAVIAGVGVVCSSFAELLMHRDKLNEVLVFAAAACLTWYTAFRTHKTT